MAAYPPVALPPLNDVANRPVQPGSPPSVNDVLAARKYRNEIAVAHGTV